MPKPIDNSYNNDSCIDMRLATNSLTMLTSILIGVILLSECAAPAATEEIRLDLATPTLFGTVVKELTSTIPTATAIPTTRPDLCVFPIDVNEQGSSIQEAALYRFNWIQGNRSQVLNTRDGPVLLESSITTPAGERQLVIVHHADLPEIIEIVEELAPDGTMIYDPLTNASEVRDTSGIINLQTITDPPEDVRGLHPNLDITKVERMFSTENDFIIRVTLMEPDDSKYIWTFETVEIFLGEERFAERTMHTGEVISIHYDPDGNYYEWDGTMIVQANTITWAMENGGKLTFGARSSTSAANGDATSPYPIELMQRLWQLSQNTCG